MKKLPAILLALALLAISLAANAKLLTLIFRAAGDWRYHR